MIWLYERNTETLRLETRFDNATGEFVLIQHQPSGARVTERFRTEEEFGARLRALSASLDEQHWQHKGPPMILDDGWKI